MKIHLLSDIHLEFAGFEPLVTDADVTILAGDIAPRFNGLKWADKVFSGRVLYIPGNHEYYGTKMDTIFPRMQALAQAETGERVQVLDRDAVVIDNVRFLCATAWSDMDLYGNQPAAASQAQQVMNDYRRIRLARERYRRLRPIDTMREASAFKLWLTQQLEQPFEGKTVVVTHHAPSQRSLRFQDQYSPCYASRWESFTEGVDLWLHGHTHWCSDYRIGDCRVMANPRGYPGESTGFDPERIIEI